MTALPPRLALVENELALRLVQSDVGLSPLPPTVHGPSGDWAKLDIFTQTNFSFLRTRYLPDGRTLLYLGNADPNYTLWVIDVTSPDDLAILSAQHDTMFTSSGGARTVGDIPRVFADDFPRYLGVGTGYAGFSGGSTNIGFQIADTGDPFFPNAPLPLSSDTHVTVGSDNSYIGAVQRDDWTFWVLFYGFVTVAQVFYMRGDGAGGIAQAGQINWAGNGQFTGQKWPGPLCLHPTATNLLYSFTEARTLIFQYDNVPTPLCLGADFAPLRTTNLSSQNWTTLRGASSPTAFALSNNPGSGSEDGFVVDFIDFTVPDAPVIDQWAPVSTGQLAASFGPQWMYDDRHVVVPCTEYNTLTSVTTWKLYHLDLVGRVLLDSWTIPPPPASSPAFFESWLSFFVTRGGAWIGYNSRAGVRILSVGVGVDDCAGTPDVGVQDLRVSPRGLR